MKYTFKTNDKIEAKRYMKADDMAFFIWELVHNAWREFKHTDYEYEKSWEKINSLLKEYNIDIDDIVE